MPCVVCGQKSRSTCSICLGTQYCSKKCQKADWKIHKKTCNLAGFRKVLRYYEKQKLEGFQTAGPYILARTGKATRFFVSLAAIIPEEVYIHSVLVPAVTKLNKQVIVVFPFGRRDLVDVVLKVYCKGPQFICMDLYGRNGHLKDMYEIEAAVVMISNVLLVSPHNMQAIRRISASNQFYTESIILVATRTAMGQLETCQENKTLPKIVFTAPHKTPLVMTQ